MNAAETKLQIAIMKWWALSWRKLGAIDECVLFHVPNGGQRGRRGAAIFKNMGVRAGVPDLLLLQPRQGFAGLGIELKSQLRMTTDAQEIFGGALLQSGYLWIVLREIADAQALIRDYLGAGTRFSAWYSCMERFRRP